MIDRRGKARERMELRLPSGTTLTPIGALA